MSTITKKRKKSFIESLSCVCQQITLLVFKALQMSVKLTSAVCLKVSVYAFLCLLSITTPSAVLTETLSIFYTGPLRNVPWQYCFVFSTQNSGCLYAFYFLFFKAEILLFKSWSPSAWQNGGIWLREDIVCIGLSLYRCSSYGCFVKMNGTGGGEWLTGTPFVCLLLVFFEFWPSLFYFKLLSRVEVFSLLKYFSLSWL